VASAAALVSTAPPDADGAELDWFADMSPSNVATSWGTGWHSHRGVTSGARQGTPRPSPGVPSGARGAQVAAWSLSRKPPQPCQRSISR
jgi:hypothetical protein